MKYFSLSAAVAGLMVAGCAGSGIATQSLAPQDRAGAPSASSMAPDAVDKNLLYVSSYSSVLVYDYGTDTEVGKLGGFSHAAGECTDALGDVYVTNWGAADVIEFAHGGSKPIKTLIDPSPYAIDCAVDPSTGNLAVINQYGQTEYSAGNVAIYADAKGKPKTYKISGFTTYVSGGYDAGGDLLVSDSAASSADFAMLAHGSGSFKAVTMQRRSGFTLPGYIRWDGEYFVVEFVPYRADVAIFEWYTIKNFKGTEEGYMSTEASVYGGGPFWVGRVGGNKSVKRANQLAADIEGEVFGWNYPRGGSYIFQFYGGSQNGGISASIVSK
jgi:hypothetical protein